MHRQNSQLHASAMRRSLAIGAAAIIVGSAGAGVSPVVVHIEASNVSGSASMDVAVGGGTWDGATKRYRYYRGTGQQLVDPGNGQVIATLNSIDLNLRKCSQIDFIMNADAGSSDTSFVVSLANLDFATIGSSVAQAKCSAAMTVTDRNNNGATLTSLGQPGDPAYSARFSNSGGEHQFAGLIAFISAGAGGTANGNQKDPPSGYRSVGADVAGMTVDMGFVVSFGDRVNVNTSFDVNPDPANCPEDADGDGVPDWLDGCPNNPSKTSPGACGCDHADVDTDGDGALDCNDNCPLDANADQGDVDGDGIGDACDPHDDRAVQPNSVGGSHSDNGSGDGSDDGDQPDSEQPDATGANQNGDPGDDGSGNTEQPDSLADSGSNPSDGATPNTNPSSNQNTVVAGTQVENLINQVAPVLSSGGCGTGMAGLLPLTAAGLVGAKVKRGGKRDK